MTHTLQPFQMATEQPSVQVYLLETWTPSQFFPFSHFPMPVSSRFHQFLFRHFSRCLPLFLYDVAALQRPGGLVMPRSGDISRVTVFMPQQE